MIIRIATRKSPLAMWQADHVADLLRASVPGAEIEFVSLTPEIALLPSTMIFGEIVANEEIGEAELFIENTGAADLEITTIDFLGDDAAAFGLTQETLDTLAAGPLILERQGSTSVPVLFTPDAVRPFLAEIVVASNDPLLPATSVALDGIGRVPYAPILEVSPLSLDFGDVGAGETAERFFQVANRGDAPLQITSVAQSGAGTFSLQRNVSGVVLEPGNSDTVFVSFDPIQPDGDSGSVVITALDPGGIADLAPQTVELLGNGGGDFPYPEAVIADCPRQVNIASPIVASFDGAGSIDPEARPLTYLWDIARRPDGADPAPGPLTPDQPQTDVRIDAAGTWEVTLVVANDLGVPSVPTTCVVEAIPIDDIYIEVSWGGPTADFDLHLARDAADFFTTPSDCSWCNRNPDWGAPGVGDDDPLLVLDDDDGLGPEIITIHTPVDGTYLVRVHHFDDGDDGTTTAEVQVFTRGVLAWSGARPLDRNEVWDVGQINWPDGTFGVSNTNNWDAAGIRECR